jgi:hypothetical protein
MDAGGCIATLTGGFGADGAGIARCDGAAGNPRDCPAGDGRTGLF